MVQSRDAVNVPVVLADTALVERELTRGMAKALQRHKLLGESIAVSRDGKVVIVPAEEIVVPDLPEDDA